MSLASGLDSSKKLVDDTMGLLFPMVELLSRGIGVESEGDRLISNDDIGLLLEFTIVDVVWGIPEIGKLSEEGGAVSTMASRPGGCVCRDFLFLARFGLGVLKGTGIVLVEGTVGSVGQS